MTGRWLAPNIKGLGSGRHHATRDMFDTTLRCGSSSRVPEAAGITLRSRLEDISRREAAGKARKRCTRCR